MSLGAKLISYLYANTDLTNSHDLFVLQQNILEGLLYNYADSPLYQILKITQEDILSYSHQDLKSFLAQFPIVEYQKHILPLLQSQQGITNNTADLHIRTSGTSDAYQGGKLIPAQRSSFDMERDAIKRTLGYYYKDNPHAKIIRPYAFSLTALFDSENNIGYVSGSMRQANALVSLIMYPSKKILKIKDFGQKRKAIINELLTKKPQLRSIHGVPAWPLSFIDELIEEDRIIAREILQYLEYVSIGGGAPEDYKQQYQKRLDLLGLHQKLYGSNNHNASEGFFGAQVRNFGDLEYHWMRPMDTSNFFVFVEAEHYRNWKDGILSHTDMIHQSSLLHEVVPGREYFMFFANDRIPWLYDIKDRVVFQKDSKSGLLEYLVTGRYSMSSNTFNEHIESDHLDTVIQRLIKEGYQLRANYYVAGMEVSDHKTSGRFYILIEGEVDQKELYRLTDRFDALMADVNAQRKAYRAHNERITELIVSVVPGGFIKSTMMKLQLGHEQSKIPHLSDHNYETIVKPLLEAL